jgi:hypothetical protein
MRRNLPLFRNSLVAALAAGLLAACASQTGPAVAPPTPELTVTPLPLSSPIFIPTVTSAPATAAGAPAGAAVTAGEALTTATTAPASALPAAPLFQIASGDVVTVTHVFSAGTQEQVFDNQTVRVSKELTTLYTYQISGTTSVKTITQDQTAAAGTTAKADSAGGPVALTSATLQAAGEKVGFGVRAPGWFPPGYAAATAGLSYSPAQKWVWQRYFTSWGTRQFVWLEFSQQSRSSAPIWNPIGGLSDVGASAQVLALSVHGQPAEYVSGGWTRTTTSDTANGQVRVIQMYQWKPLEPASVARLRWAQDDFWFEVVFHGPCWNYLCGDKDSLVQVAEGLQ